MDLIQIIIEVVKKGKRDIIANWTMDWISVNVKEL